MPDPTPAEIARDVEAETGVFNQAANIDKLLNMLKNFDIQKDNLADNDEIQVHNLLKLKRDDIEVSLGIVSV
jgi:signal transducing adaptor molecule